MIQEKNKKKKTGENNLMSVTPRNSDAEEAEWAKRTLPNLTTTGLEAYKSKLKGYIGSNEIGAGNMVIHKKIKIIEREIESRKTPPRNKTMRLEKGYKSGINMAGTSMGSYDKPMMKGADKPMMKGSGLMMKCGCQIGKHMGGPKMMGKKSCGK